MSATVLEPYQQEFISTCLSRGILRFGSFTLKSGRTSPYFFNAGSLSTGSLLHMTARAYAATIARSGIKFDVLFGPAYKGIPLAAVTALVLSAEHGIDVAYSFNRKEAKTHGEGGSIVGAPLEGRVLVLDDVITAGTAIRESMAIIEAQAGKASLAGVVVSLDRQERGKGAQSAIQEVEEAYKVKVHNVIGMADIIRYLEQEGGREQELEGMKAYRGEFGV